MDVLVKRLPFTFTLSLSNPNILEFGVLLQQMPH
jgi:hypothetical protein